MKRARRDEVASRIRTVLPALNLLAVASIMFLDWLTPAGVVVGILATVPVVASSISDDRRQVWMISAAALVGFLMAAYLGRGPISPAEVWVPNRVIAFLAIPASAGLALMLQRRRLDEKRARESAVAASELNGLLMSLLAHDLRSPFAVADQTLAHVERAEAAGSAPDAVLVADVRARLRRSLRAIDVVLEFARRDLGYDRDQTPTGASAWEAIRAEVASFDAEAAARSTRLLADLEESDGPGPAVDGRVLRQALAILLDNAVRYALPGTIRIQALLRGETVSVSVADQGPGLAAGKSSEEEGSGLGLVLCRSLLTIAGGSLEVERDEPDGTTLVLSLPVLDRGNGDMDAT